SFGFSPTQRLITSTRSGEIDFDAIVFLKDKLGINDEEVGKLLNKESGLLGLSGYTQDMEILINDYNTNERAKLAVDMYIRTICKFISYFYVLMQGCDYLTFTGGVGQGSFALRRM